MIPIERLELAQGSPILSTEAMRSPGSNAGRRPYPERVAVRELEASDGLTPHLIDLERFGRASYTLLGVDTVAREVMLWRNDEPVRVGFDGDRRPLVHTRRDSSAAVNLSAHTRWMGCLGRVSR